MNATTPSTNIKIELSPATISNPLRVWATVPKVMSPCVALSNKLMLLITTIWNNKKRSLLSNDQK